jgi:hypothetical protein
LRLATTRWNGSSCSLSLVILSFFVYLSFASFYITLGTGERIKINPHRQVADEEIQDFQRESSQHVDLLRDYMCSPRGQRMSLHRVQLEIANEPFAVPLADVGDFYNEGDEWRSNFRHISQQWPSFSPRRKSISDFHIRDSWLNCFQASNTNDNAAPLIKLIKNANIPISEELYDIWCSLGKKVPRGR